MNALVLAFISIIAFISGYRFYSVKLQKLWEVSPENQTPAFKNFDGVDYVPAKNWLVLFGHHFSSIAGAGPILGPVIACAIWGWLPAVVWIVFGSIFLGGVHDFSTLMISLRNDGRSIADVSEKVFGKKAKIFFSIFIILALVLVVAVFAITAAKTLQNSPQIVIPTFALILIAVIVGFMLYRWKINAVVSTITGVVLAVFFLIVGYKFPVGLRFADPVMGWTIIFLIYAGVASLLPVNFLLQPRDYLSSFFLFAGPVSYTHLTLPTKRIV